MQVETLLDLPDVTEITSKMHQEEVVMLGNLLRGFLETKEEINRLYDLTNDDEQLKAFAINTAKALASKEE